MVVVDAIDGHVVTTLPIGDGCDGVKFNPAPEATADNPRPRLSAKPDSFYVMDIAPTKK